MEAFSKVYDGYAQAKRVVHELELAGIPSSDISLVANNNVTEHYTDGDETSAAATGMGLGAALGGGAGLLAGLGLLAIPGLGPVVAAGWLASTALGAVAGTATGGILGALVGAGTPEQDAHVYSEAVRRGGTLVTVRTDQSPERVQHILDAHEPIDPIGRRKQYEESGWTGFDPDAAPYKPDEAETERMRRRI